MLGQLQAIYGQRYSHKSMNILGRQKKKNLGNQTSIVNKSGAKSGPYTYHKITFAKFLLMLS